jgi:hypothetical protein
MAVAKPLNTDINFVTSILFLLTFLIHPSLRPLLFSSDDKAERKACSEASYRSFCAVHPSGDSSDKAHATTLSCNPHTFLNLNDCHVKAMIFLDRYLESASERP